MISYKYLLLFILLGLIPTQSFAEENEGKEQISEDVQLERLFEEISRNPSNLNNNFRYAQLATKLGKYYESIAAYERMILIDPNLDRVKLDLALLYIKVGNTVEAKELFTEVKAKNPPKQVIDNINAMLLAVKKSEKRHHFGGTLTLGYNSDSNPSASPNSGAVDVFGIGIPIDDATGGAADEQQFVYVSINHSYAISSEQKHVWNSEAGFYKAVQDNASSLNTSVYSLKTGPVFNTKGKRLRYGIKGTYSNVNLDEFEYLNSAGYEIFADYIMSRNVKARLTHTHERRRFQNSPTVTTYEDRNGTTNEEKITITSMLTPKDIFNTSLSLRREHAKVDYYTNRSRSFSFNYTKILKKGFFVNAGVLYKRTSYKGADSFVNPNIIREDGERTVTFGIGQNLTDGLSGSVIYQNKEIGSNIQNFAYSNERITVSINFKF